MRIIIGVLVGIVAVVGLGYSISLLVAENRTIWSSAAAFLLAGAIVHVCSVLANGGNRQP